MLQIPIFLNLDILVLRDALVIKRKPFRGKQKRWVDKLHLFAQKINRVEDGSIVERRRAASRINCGILLRCESFFLSVIHPIPLSRKAVIFIRGYIREGIILEGGGLYLKGVWRGGLYLKRVVLQDLR